MTTFVFLVSKFGGFGVNYWDLFLLLFLHIPGNCNYYLKRCDPACEADRNQETSYLLMNISQPNEAKRPSLWILPKGLLPNNNNNKKIKKKIYIYVYLFALFHKRYNRPSQCIGQLKNLVSYIKQRSGNWHLFLKRNSRRSSNIS